jgi:hypothetical protein
MEKSDTVKGVLGVTTDTSEWLAAWRVAAEWLFAHSW